MYRIRLVHPLLALFLGFTSLSGFSLGQVSAQEKISLAETAPGFIQTAMRNRKFYGDPLTVNGDIGERSYLTGNWGGLRDNLIDNGVYTYAGLTQHFGGNIDGGNARKARANGSLDLMMWLDTGKAGLWSGGGFLIHGETGYANNWNGDTGSLIPANFDGIVPDPDTPKAALPQFYYVQALGEDLMFSAGKMDLASFADTNLFANHWRYQFMSTGLVNNPQVGAVVPYSTYAMWLSKKITDRMSLVYTVNTQDSLPTQADFDTIFNGNMVHSLLWNYDTTIGDRPGLFTGVVGYASGEQADFAIDARHASNEILGLVPVQQTESNYGVFLSGSQYLKTWGSGHKKGCRCAPSRPLGIGLFWRYGWTPEDRNVITQFASAGLGGYGGPAGRIHDNWGIGWAGSYISPDLRNALGLVEDVNPWEHTIETYYNFQLTPATHLSFHVQSIHQAIARLNTSTVLGTRLQVDF